jgi:hypothetical protein
MSFGDEIANEAALGLVAVVFSLCLVSFIIGLGIGALI